MQEIVLVGEWVVKHEHEREPDFDCAIAVTEARTASEMVDLRKR